MRLLLRGGTVVAMAVSGGQQPLQTVVNNDFLIVAHGGAAQRHHCPRPSLALCSVCAAFAGCQWAGHL
ncbi:MAG: hypothetical protein GKR94_09495 [Gammaproteobacteria bacterium]|nr:hypothetical protein [Gammaproteobacteria bacterium]